MEYRVANNSLSGVGENEKKKKDQFISKKAR